MHLLLLHCPTLWVLFFLPIVASFRWGTQSQGIHNRQSQLPPANISPSELLKSALPHSMVYQIALSELQELETEPLCHRVAARLLVNNCQLLDGQDEASVLTGGGRMARDFVDSYAASLAICDLEKGSFHIPSECQYFREPVLSRLQFGDKAHLHVSPSQIKACLTGLAGSASAWNTWVSYSHKAEHFCEAARADHEKTQNILVFQHLTRVMAKLANDVDADLQKRAEAWNDVADKMNEKMERVLPRMDKLQQQLAEIDQYIEHDLASNLNSAMETTAEGLFAAESLHKLLAVMAKTVLETNSQVARAHEQSIERAVQQVNTEMDIFTSAMMDIMSSSLAIRNDLQASLRHTDDLASRQTALEHGIQRLSNITDKLSTNYDAHTLLLTQATNLTNDLLDTLQATATSAFDIQGSLLRFRGVRNLWPFLFFPTVSLVLGSYGLPPSMLRNAVLVVIGEVLGVAVSSYHRFYMDALLFLTSSNTASNTTGILA